MHMIEAEPRDHVPLESCMAETTIAPSALDVPLSFQRKLDQLWRIHW